MVQEQVTLTLPLRMKTPSIMAAPSVSLGGGDAPRMARDCKFPPLQEDKSQIRLFDLAPGTPDDDEFRGNYRIICLDSDSDSDSDEMMTPYQTMSYVWGAAGVDDDIYVTVDGWRVEVTANLQAALRRIRHPTRTTTLWVDSICINQHDDREKTRQVNMMHRIYRSCARCLIWMGEVPVDSTEETEEEAIRGARGALDAIRIWSDMDDEFELPETLAGPEDQAAAGRALDKLMEAQWWQRIWTLQEALAPRKARVLWGPLTLPWALIRQAACNVMTDYRAAWGLDWSAFFTSGDCGPFTAPVVGLNIAAGWKETKPRPIEMLHRFRYREASDPRDKVFALFGLSRDDWSFLPGLSTTATTSHDEFYELDVVTLYKRVTMDLLRDAANNGDDRGLHALIGQRGESRRTPGLPSWTVDWARSEAPLSQFWVHNRFLWYFTADRGLPRLDVDALQVPGDDTVIRLNGVYVDQVAVRSDVMTDEHLEDARGMFDTLINEYLSYLKKKKTQEDETGCWLDKPTEQWHDEFDELMTLSFINRDEDQDHWLQSYWPGQRIFITSQGCVGLGPSTAASDDEVWAFSGGRYPFLMRVWGEDEAERGEAQGYEMVGDVFMPDIMAGQAIESRLDKQRFITVH